MAFNYFFTLCSLHFLDSNKIFSGIITQYKEVLNIADESGDSRHTTPSVSPRHSPSSCGDDLSLNPSSIIASDAKSVDSGGCRHLTHL